MDRPGTWSHCDRRRFVGLGGAAITGAPVDLAALDAVNQFLYMGSEDENDTIPFDDAWTSEELRQTALLVYGEDMITERFPFCQTAYERAGVSARFEIIEGAGHAPVDTERLVAFHRQSMNGTEPEGFGEDLSAVVEEVGTATARFRVEGELVAGRPVRFRGGRSTGDEADVVAYSWELGDGETAAGESVEHSYEAAGDYLGPLRIVDGNGVQATTRQEVTIAAGGPSQPTPTAAGDAGTTTPATDTPAGDGIGAVTDAVGPGFGTLGALLGLGGGAARLLHRDGSDEA